jgi:hypothetical protein
MGTIDAGTERLEAVFAALDPERRAVAEALRREIRAIGPHLSEDVKWAAPVWSGRKLVFCLMVYDHHVNLGFFQGASLAGRHAAIVGTGKALRHMRVATPKDARTPAVRAAIRDAIRWDGGRVPAVRSAAKR